MIISRNTRFRCGLGIAVLAAVCTTSLLPAPSLAAPAVTASGAADVMRDTGRARLIEVGYRRHKHRYYRRHRDAVAVDAPTTRVYSRRGHVEVDAPFTHVRRTRDGVRVRAPFVDLWLPYYR
ncbi:MAG: hypothetical protein KDJ37_04790 [Hyphomicrobiaceae bacterium]|nr:hypothetical protein [Hyphomicrobiaceae bacterium]